MSPRLADALLRSQSDERLVALAQEGRERAFTTLVERHRKPLLAFAGRLVGTERAEDVVQQALLQAWAALQRGSKVGHTRGWLHQIVRHAAYKATARTPNEAALPAEVAVGADSIAALEQRLEASDLLAAMQELPDRQREAIVQTALQGRSREEVADSLGLSEGAVRQLVHRARTSLRAVATAVTPWPLVEWAARVPAGAESAPMAERLGEIAAGAGAGSAGAAGALVKAGAVVLATGAVATGVVESRRGGHDGSRPDSAAQKHGGTGATAPGGSGSAAGTTRVADDHGGRGRSGRGGDDHSGRGRGGDDGSRGRHGRDGSSSGRGDGKRDGSGSSGPGSGGSGSGTSGTSGSGGSGSGSSGSGSSGSGSGTSGSGSGTSGSGSGTSGSGSGTSGSDSSGSGTSGSGTSGSGTSGSGTSGSDTSGSGTSGSGTSGSGTSGSGTSGSGTSGSGTSGSGTSDSGSGTSGSGSGTSGSGTSGSGTSGSGTSADD